MQNDLHSQVLRLEQYFDEIHDYLVLTDGIDIEISATALKGSLFCRALLCDILNEQENNND